MVEGETPGRAVFRLLELIALLLPVIAILVQVSINTYQEQKDNIRPGVRFSTLLLLIGGVLALLFGAHQLAVHLDNGRYGFSPAVVTALDFIEVGLALVGASVVFLAAPLLIGAGIDFALAFISLVPTRQQVHRVPGDVGERLSDWGTNNHDDETTSDENNRDGTQTQDRLK